MKNLTYYLLADDSKYYRCNLPKEELQILLLVTSSYFGVRYGVPFVVNKIISFVRSTRTGCIIAFGYTKLPVRLGSYSLTLINPIKVVKGTLVLTKYLMWDRRILLNVAQGLSNGVPTIGWRPVHVIIYCVYLIYFNWHWNLFNEIDDGFARGNQPDHIYYRRFRKQRILQPGEKRDPVLEKWVPGLVGTPFRGIS